MNKPQVLRKLNMSTNADDALVKTFHCVDIWCKHTHACTHNNRNYSSHLSKIYSHLYLTWTLVVSMGLALSCIDKQTLGEKGGGMKKKQREEKVGGKKKEKRERGLRELN